MCSSVDLPEPDGPMIAMRSAELDRAGRVVDGNDGSLARAVGAADVDARARAGSVASTSSACAGSATL